MATPTGKVPILESASAGLRFAVQRMASTAPTSAIGAAIAASIGVLLAGAGANPAVTLLGQAAAVILGGAIYAHFSRLAFAQMGVTAPGSPLESAARLLGAMVVVGFFLFIVSVVMMVAAIIVLGTSLAPHAAEIEAASGDPARTLALLEQIITANPAPFLLLAGVVTFVWLALTSRLYVAAPATIAEARVRTFETWAWTKGSMLRIMAARIMLLGPALIIIAIAQGMMGMVLGVAPGDPAALQSLAASPVKYFAFAFVSNFATFILYNAAGAGLSAYLYRGLRPTAAV